MFGGNLLLYTKLFNWLYYINLVKAYIVLQNRFETNKTQNFITTGKHTSREKEFIFQYQITEQHFWVEEA